MHARRSVLGGTLVALSIAAACSSAGGGGSELTPGSGGGTSGSAGTGAAGTGAAAGSAGDASSTGGSGGSLFTDSGADGSGGDGGIAVNDAAIDTGEGLCTDAGSVGPGPYARSCAPMSANECDGNTDTNSSFPNGTTGNGFDDDCDGSVDEGCDCGTGVGAGETKECWLVPASQADPSGAAVGWCASNSKGTTSCTVQGTGEFARRQWDGECRGAQPPFADDACAMGDFDCDGTEANSQTIDCSCDTTEVVCPTAPVGVFPYPDPANLPFVDGASWITSGNAAQATNWRWSAVGGDCDNILPHPSFQIYNSANANATNSVGIRTTGLGPAGNQVGHIAGPGGGIGSRIYTAFALSGDYLVTGSFDLNGKSYSCTVKVQVRAPGIRAEACWAPMPSDMDLHFARLQNGDSCTNNGHGWFQTCRSDERADDCYYNSDSGCRGFSSDPSAWGYARSAGFLCHGWGSRRDALTPCDNPRLDSDNISCNPNDPFVHSGFLQAANPNFCSAENINLDNPKNGERFAIGLHAYGSLAGGTTVRNHINIYCNGQRRLALGFDPNTGENHPAFTESGADSGGDFWSAAVVEAVVDGSGSLTDCLIETVPSQAPKANKDGSANYCVDTGPQNNGSATDQDWLFTNGGGYPTNAAELCWH